MGKEIDMTMNYFEYNRLDADGEGVILNLTQHRATAEQRAAGVMDIEHAKTRERLLRLLTFDSLPRRLEINTRAREIAGLACAYFTTWLGTPVPEWLTATHTGGRPDTRQHRVMIGGAPWLMGPLEHHLRRLHMEPVYAFSRRESVEEVAEDGSVIKRAVFRHLGFV